MASYPAPPDQGRRLSEALANATASGRLGIDRQRLGLERSNLDMLIERHRAEQAARDRQLDISERAQRLADEREYVDPSEYQPFLPPSMRSDVPSGRMRRTTFEAMLPGWRGESERRRAMEQGGTVAGKLRDLYGETTEGPVAEGMYGPGSPVKTVPKRIETLAQLLETIGATEKTLPLIEKETGPEESVILGPGQRAVGKRSGKEIATGGAARPKVDMRAGAGDTFAITTDPETGEPVGEPRALGIGAPESKSALTRADIEGALTEAGWKTTMPGYRAAYLSLARQVSVPPGGASFGLGEFVVPPPPGASPRVPAPPAAPKGPTPTVERPVQPNAGEREDIANLDAAERQIQTVIESLKSPGGLGAVMGSIGKNAKGARARFTEEYFGFGMTDEQRRMMGTLSIQLQSIKHALIGATRTRPELADIAAAIPDEKSLLRGDSAEQAISKLTATLNDLRTKRASRENAMRSTGVAVPSRPKGGSEPPKPATESLSRRDPLYQKARAKGLTDAQIQQQYGVKVTD